MLTPASMGGGRADRIEAGMDALAAGALAAGAGTCLFLLSFALPAVGAGAAIAFAGVFAGLRAIAPEPQDFLLPALAPGELPVTESDELLLTDVYRSSPPIADELLLTDVYLPEPPICDELILDDILEKLSPNSRVVRLFDPAAMPTPGHLKARIDRHLNGESPATPLEDASQALHEALAELRRSLR